MRVLDSLAKPLSNEGQAHKTLRGWKDRCGQQGTPGHPQSSVNKDLACRTPSLKFNKRKTIQSENIQKV